MFIESDLSVIIVFIIIMNILVHAESHRNVNRGDVVSQSPPGEEQLDIPMFKGQ